MTTQENKERKRNYMLSKKEKSYFTAAKEESYRSDHHYKIGCVIVNGHKIISYGHNSNTKCHPLQAKADIDTFGVDCPGKVHAEFEALLPMIKSHQDLSHATVYVFRQHSNNCVALARPCSRCMSLIRRAGIKKIKYTGENSYITETLNE